MKKHSAEQSDQSEKMSEKDSVKEVPSVTVNTVAVASNTTQTV